MIGEKVTIPEVLQKTLKMDSETIELPEEFRDFQQYLMGLA